LSRTTPIKLRIKAIGVVTTMDGPPRA
jgi:hypothetical protein